MKAVVEINLNSPQAVLLLGYLESLPYAKVKKEKQDSSMAALLNAAGPGAMTIEQAMVKFDEAIRKAYVK
jgi:hypothetical protein